MSSESPAVVWKGADQLREFLVPVEDLELHPQNPRRGKVALIAESLERFGQVRMLLTDGGRIVAGNHTYRAALALGWTHIAAVPHDFQAEGESRAYLLADNRLPELGDYDRELLLAHLEDVDASGSWQGTGYDLDALDDLRSLHGRLPVTATEPFTGDFAVTPEELAARTARLAAGNTYKELVLALTADQGAEFESHMKILRKEYGEPGGVADVVSRAVAEQSARP